MNDFTKEELHGLMDSLIQSNWIYEDERKALQEKIQSMIDNYERDQQVRESLNYVIQKAREWDFKL